MVQALGMGVHRGDGRCHLGCVARDIVGDACPRRSGRASSSSSTSSPLSRSNRSPGSGARTLPRVALLDEPGAGLGGQRERRIGVVALELRVEEDRGPGADDGRPRAHPPCHRQGVAHLLVPLPLRPGAAELLVVLLVDQRVPAGPRALHQQHVGRPAQVFEDLVELAGGEPAVDGVHDRPALVGEDPHRVLVDRGVLDPHRHPDVADAVLGLQLEDDRLAPGEADHLAPVQHRPVGGDVERQIHRQRVEEVGVEVVEVLVRDDQPGDTAPVPVEEVVIRRELEPGGVEGAARRQPGVHQQMGVAGGQRQAGMP